MRKKIKYNFYLIWGSLQSLKYGMLPWIKCTNCGKRRWSEEIIVGCGACDDCWDVMMEMCPPGQPSTWNDEECFTCSS